MSEQDRTWRGLRAMLITVLGSDYVYYQAPSKEKIHYPCIIFERSKITTNFANDRVYGKRTRYTVTYIDSTPQDTVPNNLLDLPYCTHDRDFASDNKYHSVFTIYY